VDSFASGRRGGSALQIGDWDSVTRCSRRRRRPHPPAALTHFRQSKIKNLGVAPLGQKTDIGQMPESFLIPTASCALPTALSLLLTLLGR